MLCNIYSEDLERRMLTWMHLKKELKKRNEHSVIQDKNTLPYNIMQYNPVHCKSII